MVSSGGEESVTPSRTVASSDSGGRGGFTSYPDKNWKMLLIFVGVTIQHPIAAVKAMLTIVHPLLQADCTRFILPRDHWGITFALHSLAADNRPARSAKRVTAIKCVKRR